MRLRLNWIDQAPRVLLVHPDASTLDSWRGAFLDCAIETTTDAGQLEVNVELHAPDVVIGQWNNTIVERLRTRWPTIRFIHFGGGLSTSVLEAISQGQEIFHVERLEDLESKVFAVAKPRRRSSRRLATNLHVTWPGAPHRFQVADISSEGLSFLTLPGDDLSRLQPGTELGPIEVGHEARIALSHVSARIRRIEVREPAYLIGCEVYRTRQTPQTPLRVISDPALCAGLLHNAVHSGVLFLTEPATGDLVQPIDGALDPDRRELAIELVHHAFKLFDIIDGQFELSGGSYRFRAVVRSEYPLKLTIPTALEETRQRATSRWRPKRHRLGVRLGSPLFPEPLVRNLHDLSVNGLSFDITAQDVFPPGMHFDRIELELGSETVVVQGRVRSLARGPETARCGVELEGLDDTKRSYLADFIVRARYPGVENGRTTTFDELWGFFREAGFLYPEKEAILAPLMPEVRRAFVAINARPNAISSSVAIRQEGTLVGYCAGLQAYRTTWMFHHLAALPGNAAGALLSMGTVEHLMQSVEFEYFRMWFFAEASFPRRIFGSFARKVGDASQSLLRYYAHFHVPVDRRFVSNAKGIETSEATDDELFAIERNFIRTDHPIAVRAEDLTASGLRLDAVSQAYRREGVGRRRHVIAARRGGEVLGVALAELSSPGLNLSEAMSSFRVFVLPVGQVVKADVRRALIDAALALYASAGRVVGRCLIDPNEAKDFEALGIELDKGRSICWTGHRVQLPPFIEHMRNLFTRLAVRRQRIGALKKPDAS
jgi:hypothetical protein